MPRMTVRRDERGSALVSVVGIVLVTIVIAVTISATTISALDRTGETRETVSADFAAEAGIAAAQADLEAGRCTTHGPTYQSGTANGAPFYRAVVLKRTATGEQLGCPSDTQAARIVSTGYAGAPGYTAKNGVKRSLEAVYSRSPVPLNPSGPAVFAYSSQGMGGSGKLVAENGLEPSVHVREGNVTCDGGSSGDADWVIRSGTFTAQGSCVVAGNVWASGDASTTGDAKIGGDLLAQNLHLTGGTISGSTWSRGKTTIGWGTTISTNMTVGTDLFYEGATVGRTTTPRYGSVWVNGTANLNSHDVNIKGQIRAGVAVTGTGKPQASPTPIVGTPVGAPAAPAAPVVADWVDLPYDPEMWAGFTPVTLSGNCTYDSFSAAIATIAGRPGLIDARACLNIVTISDYQKLTIENDLAIFAKKFDLAGSASFASADGDQLWLINEDATADHLPTCNNQQLKIGGGFYFTNVPVMFYSPCRVEIASSLNVRGQIFAGAVTVAGGATLTYTPAGLPGFDLSTGQPSSPASARELTAYTTAPDSAERWIP